MFQAALAEEQDILGHSGNGTIRDAAGAYPLSSGHEARDKEIQEQYEEKTRDIVKG